MRSVVRWSMGLVALAAAALSYQSLMHLGQLCGYGALSVLYPLVVDAGAAASCAAWLHTRGRQALAMTWALLAISVVLNGTTHYLEATGTAPSWLLVVAVAAVPPTVLGLCVHLAVGLGGPGRLALPHSESTGPTYPEGVMQVTSETDGGADDTPTGANAPLDPVAALIEAGVGRRAVARKLSISEHQARVLIEQHRNGAVR